MRKPGDKEGYLAKLEDVEAVKKRVGELTEEVENLKEKVDRIEKQLAKLPKFKFVRVRKRGGPEVEVED